jgi:hypothetical protein
LSFQAAFRGYAARKDLNTQNTAATTIQKNYRGHKTRKDLDEQDKSARVIQRNFRSYQEQKNDRPWWRKFCDKCSKFGKKITGTFHKERYPGRSPSFLKEKEEEYKSPLKNPYDENPAQVEEYNIPEGKKLTLLQLSKICDKKQEQNVEENKPQILAPPKLVAGMDSVQADTGAYQQSKSHKVIKYHAPTPESPEKKLEEPVESTSTEPEGEESNFFTRLFKPAETKPEEKKPESEHASEDVFGKFKGLFTRDEKPKEPDVEPLVASEEKGEEEEEVVQESEEEEDEQPQIQQEEEKVDVLARFQNRFKKEYNIATPQVHSGDATDSKVEPKQEAEDEGTFSKFTGLFKSENKESLDTSNKEDSSLSSKFTGLFKKDESDINKGDSGNHENNGDVVKKDNQEEGGFFGKLFKKDEEKSVQEKSDNPTEESGIDKMFSIFKKN